VFFPIHHTIHRQLSASVFRSNIQEILLDLSSQLPLITCIRGRQSFGTCGPHSTLTSKRRQLLGDTDNKMNRSFLGKRKWRMMKYTILFHRSNTLIPVALRSKAWGLRLLAYRDFGFESWQGHGWLSLVSVVRCQVQVSCNEIISRPEESYRVWCVWVWSWSLDNEDALVHWWLLRHDEEKI